MIRIGVAGWSYDDWHGPVYPRRKPPGFHPLPWIASFLDLVEVNSTFYALPDPRHAERWVRRVEETPAFRFTAKLHQAFTHGPPQEGTAAAAEAFRLGLSPLADAGRLLCLLVQFPASFQAREAGWERLQRIRDLFPEEHLVLELRHRSWFTDAALPRLEEAGFGLAHVDLPSARDHPPEEHPSLAGPGYLRLHGRNAATWFDPRAGRDARYDYRYGRGEVEELAARLQGLAARSEKALLVANNHYGGQAVAAALEIKAQLEGAPPRAPPTLVEAFPDLRGRVRTWGQQTLF